MKLENLTPKPVKLELNEKIYIFRPVNLEDFVWIGREFSSIDKIFSGNVDFKALSRIAYRLLTDKSAYKLVEEVDYNEDGEVSTVKIGGVRLFEREFSGMDGLERLIDVIVEAFGMNSDEDEAQGKKQAQPSKKK